MTAWQSDLCKRTEVLKQGSHPTVSPGISGATVMVIERGRDPTVSPRGFIQIIYDVI